MSTYQCQDCDLVSTGEECGTQVESFPDSTWGQTTRINNTYLTCPDCGGEVFEIEKLKLEVDDDES